MGSASMTNHPEASVVALPAMDVPSAETSAPLIGPPRSSLTTPVMLPRTDRTDWYCGVWACAIEAPKKPRLPAASDAVSIRAADAATFRRCMPSSVPASPAVRLRPDREGHVARHRLSRQEIRHLHVESILAALESGQRHDLPCHHGLAASRIEG